MERQKINSLVIEWLILLLCFGYPLQAMVVSILKTDSTPVNIGFRAVYLLLSFYMIFIGIRNNQGRFPFAFYIFILFWLIYGFRIVYDTEVNGVTYMDKNKYYVYAFAFGNTLIPTLAVFMNSLLINIKRLTKNLYGLLVVSNICIAVCLVIFTVNGMSGIFAARAVLFIPIKGTMVNILNPITISFFGELLCLASITLFILGNEKKLLWYRWLYLFSFSLGIFILIAGASRGPMISFLILFFILVISRTNVTKSLHDMYFAFRTFFSRLYRGEILSAEIIKKFFWFLFVMIFLGAVVILVLNNLHLVMLTRMKAFFEIKPLTNDGRIGLWQSAWEQIKSHPIIGDRFLTRLVNSYSHNLILDSLMATGIIGTIFFLIYLGSPFFLFFKLNNTGKIKYLVIWMVFLAVFLVSMVSGGLWISSDFWILSALLIGLFTIDKNRMEQELSKSITD